jgi:hypothetical protein
MLRCGLRDSSSESGIGEGMREGNRARKWPTARCVVHDKYAWFQLSSNSQERLSSTQVGAKCMDECPWHGGDARPRIFRNSANLCVLRAPGRLFDGDLSRDIRGHGLDARDLLGCRKPNAGSA